MQIIYNRFHTVCNHCDNAAFFRACKSKYCELCGLLKFFIFNFLTYDDHRDILLSDEFNGAVKVPIIVQFKLKDYKYVKNFRDLHGLESKMIYSKVKEVVHTSFCY